MSTILFECDVTEFSLIPNHKNNENNFALCEKSLVIKDIFNRNNFLLEIIKEPIRLVEGKYYVMSTSVNYSYNLQILYTLTTVKLINNKNELTFEMSIQDLYEHYLGNIVLCLF